MNAINHKPIYRTIGVVGGVIGMIAIGLYAEHHAFFQPLRKSLQQQTVSSGVLSYGAMGKILRRLDFIQVLPNDYSSYTHQTVNTFRSRLPVIQKKSRIGIHVYGFGAVEPEEMPGSTIIPQAALSEPTPLLSIVLDHHDLYDPLLGLLTNPDEKGRNWERPAYISYFEQGKLLFATGAGIRIHGGVCRDAPKKSFRVYFKDIYGTEQFKPGILFDKSSDPLTRFVVRSKFETAGLFANSLAYDITRRIGALAPQTQPVRLFLNGEYQGVYILMEHISRGYLLSHFGHDRFFLARSKSSSPLVLGSLKIYKQFLTWTYARTPLTMTEAAQRVDLDNFSRWIISVLFCATPDALQGPVLLDLSRSDAKWFWINWDMDHSLAKTNLNYAPNAWEEDIFQRFYMTEPRSVLYHRLRLGSPEFRRYFMRLFADSMNHRLTREFLQERIEYYATLALSFGLDNREFNEEVTQFFAYRKPVLRDQMKTYFDSGDSYSCRVNGPDDVRFEIDGYPEKPGYAGWYFEKTPITISITDAANRSFSHWLINGEEVRTDITLQYPVESETTIEAVFLPTDNTGL